MSSDKQKAPLDLGIYGRQIRPKIDSTDFFAAVLSLVWVATVAALWFFLGGPGDEGKTFNPVNFVITLVSIILPIGLIWVASSVAKTARVMRQEALRLQTSIDAMRNAYVTQQHTAGQHVKPSLEDKLGEIAEAQKTTQNAIATFASRRDLPSKAQPSTTKAALSKKLTAPRFDEPTLELGTYADELKEPISISEFIRAMNFPENEDDAEGFRTLRRALDDRVIARMIRASQDILTLLSQDGIYMDDLRPQRPRAEDWRRFAKGERGKGVNAIGGIRDRSCLALASGRMKSDPVFRDATHHFLRQFDGVLADFEANASNQELLDMGETRTARAFMLLGRATGTFS